jgi:hypothetical protein
MAESGHRQNRPSHRRLVASFSGYLDRIEFEDEREDSATFLKADACFIEQPTFQLIVDKTPDTILEEERYVLLQKAHSFPRRTVSPAPVIAEKELQLRRQYVTSSLQKLYDERKELIFELFQQSWVISDLLEG